MNTKPGIGSITWCDLTVPNADEVKIFYEKVVGWKSEPVSMGDYNDFSMIAPEVIGLQQVFVMREELMQNCHHNG